MWEQRLRAGEGRPHGNLGEKLPGQRRSEGRSESMLRRFRMSRRSKGLGWRWGQGGVRGELETDHVKVLGL